MSLQEYIYLTVSMLVFEPVDVSFLVAQTAVDWH